MIISTPMHFLGLKVKSLISLAYSTAVNNICPLSSASTAIYQPRLELGRGLIVRKKTPTCEGPRKRADPRAKRVRGNSVVGKLLAGSWMIVHSISVQNFDVLVFDLLPFQPFKLLVSRIKSRS